MRKSSTTRWLNRLLLLLNAILIMIGFWFFSTRDLATSRSIEYKDLVIIILTALGVMLAAVTLFVGALAIYGYATLKDFAGKVAEDTARRVAAPVAAREAEAIQGQEPGRPGRDLVAELQTGGVTPKEDHAS